MSSFQGRDKKLDKFLAKNQHSTPRKLLYFVNRHSVMKNWASFKKIKCQQFFKIGHLPPPILVNTITMRLRILSANEAILHQAIVISG
jgi:hypothetical protein